MVCRLLTTDEMHDDDAIKSSTMTAPTTTCTISATESKIWHRIRFHRRQGTLPFEARRPGNEAAISPWLIHCLGLSSMDAGIVNGTTSRRGGVPSVARWSEPRKLSASGALDCLVLRNTELCTPYLHKAASWPVCSCAALGELRGLGCASARVKKRVGEGA